MADDKKPQKPVSNVEQPTSEYIKNGGDKLIEKSESKTIEIKIK